MQADGPTFLPRRVRPALAKRLALRLPEDSLLPTTSTGWYLHYHYIATGPKPYGDKRVNLSSTDKSAYGQAVARLLPELKADIDRLEQQNLLFVDPETLDVFFSLEQSSILGTNLLNGPYASSNLSELVQKLRNSQSVDDYRVADFEAYRPALGSPRASVGTPIFDGPRMSAIMILRLPIGPITRALSGNGQWEADGLGKTGEVYLLGPDETMRTDSRFLRGSRGVPRHTPAIDPDHPLGRHDRKTRHHHLHAPGQARGGKRGAARRDRPESARRLPRCAVLDGVRTLDLDSLRWGMIAKIDQAEAMAPLHVYARRMLAWSVGLSLVATSWRCCWRRC